MWPFRKQDPEPDDDPDEPIEIIATPLAGMVNEMISFGFTREQIVYVLQRVEVERARARAEIQSAVTDVTPTRATKVRNPAQLVTRNHLSRPTQPKKRNRASYMRDYRARLRLVTNNGTRNKASDDIA